MPKKETGRPAAADDAVLICNMTRPSRPCSGPQRSGTEMIVVGHEKCFVDLIVAHNPNVIDLEMGLPAYSNAPGKNRAPRIDLRGARTERWLVARSILWEAKLVDDGVREMLQEGPRCAESRRPACGLH